jgi:hypothetical protein
MIRQREAAIGPAEAVLADGDALLLELGRLDDAALAAKAAARRATVLAQAATRALVADLRRLRADWSSAANHGPMPELELEEAKSASDIERAGVEAAKLAPKVLGHRTENPATRRLWSESSSSVRKLSPRDLD